MSMNSLRVKVRNERRRIPLLRPAWLLAMLGAFGAAPASAEDVPSSFEIKEHPIQKVPTTFKFQARVSQGKIPTGDATFPKVYVNLKRGTGEILCTETLSSVKVRDSVLNLEVGRGMSCQLDEVVANNADLSFQICVNNTESCLKPIALSTVPFAVKSSFSAQAQEAYKSDVAAQCNYAHRVTADPDLFLTKSTGSGYYDFHTPTAADLLVIDGQSVEGGFMQWTPITTANKLNVCAKSEKDGKLVKLAELLLHSQVTRALGELQVAGDAKLGGNLEVAKAAHVGTTLEVVGETHLASELLVQGTSNLGAGVSVAGNSSFKTGTFTFDGDVVFNGKVTLPSGNVVAGNSVNGAAVVDGSLTGIDLADNSIGSNHVIDGALQSVDIANGAITSADLADQSVVGAKIGPGAVWTSHIADGALSEAKLATGVVSSRAIGDGAVTGTDVATSTLSGSHIADGSIGSADIAANQITSSHIVDGQVTSADIADYSIGYGDIAGAQISSWHIIDGNVLSADIADGNVTSVDIANKTITSDDVQFSPRRIAYTFTDSYTWPSGVYASQYSVCVMVNKYAMASGANCSAWVSNNQWMLYGYQASCGYFCF